MSSWQCQKLKEDDIDCVTHWSRIGDDMGRDIDESYTRKGKTNRQIYNAMVKQHGYSTNTPIENTMTDQAMLAFNFNDKPLEPKHGGPLRGLIPELYFGRVQSG